MVLHSIPHDSTFLLNKFRLLNEVLGVKMLVWDSRKNIERLRVDKNLKSRIYLGLSSTKFNAVALHCIGCLFALIQRPGKLIQFYLFLKNKLGWLKAGGALLKYYQLILLKPKVIHFEFGTLGKSMLYLKEFFHFKAVVSFRGYDLNYVGLEDPSYYEMVWRKCDGFHFLGHDLLSRAIKRGYKRKTGFEVLIPPAVDANFFKRTVPYPEVKDKIIILSVGRIVWKKGIEYSLRLVKKLLDAGYPIEYRIVGSGDYLQAIRYTIFELNLSDHVKILGPKTPVEIKNEMEKAHLFLHLAISEGFCNAVIEAQSMELPIVCSDADGLAENIEDEVTGFVVPKWELAEAQDKIVHLFKSNGRAKEMGMRGRERVVNRFLIQDQINQFKEFYLKVCELT